jgi:SSS family solute:Na+ symporter
MTHLSSIDYLLMLVYFTVVLIVGWMLRRSTRTSTDFFLSGRSIPSWGARPAVKTANHGAQEMKGKGA